MHIIMNFVVLGLPALALSAAAVAAPEVVKPLEVVPGPIKMKSNEIRSHNAGLKPTDPTYIVCLKTESTGSIVLRTTCRMRGEWARLARPSSNDAVGAFNDARTRQFGASDHPSATGPIGGKDF